MERQKKVIDASIVVKWFQKEEHREEAIELRNEHINEQIIIIVPEIIFLEVLNALRYKGGSKEELEEANNLLWDIQFQIEYMNQFLLKKAIDLTVQYDLTLYDAIYAALSQIHGCPLITEDEKLKKIPSAVEL
mgnify:CR=1 FL=1